MKNLFYLLLFLPIALLTSCSDSSSSSTPIVSGCTDDCALNYNPDANQDDGSCIYSFLGTYIFSEYKVAGVSLFSSSVANPLVAGAISFGVADNGVGVYGISFGYTDGTQISGGGTFTNSLTSLTLYPQEGGSETYTTTKVNCLEFDGYTYFDGQLVEIELTYSSTNSRIILDQSFGKATSLTPLDKFNSK